MNFSPEWNDVYREGKQDIRWPWSDVVSYVMRYARPTGADFKVLELGCGSGANIPFFKSLPCDYFAVDGSEYMVQRLRATYPELRDHIVRADFTVEIPLEEQFDLVVDRGSMPCNSGAAISEGLAQAYKKLKTGGSYVGIDWFSTKHPDFKKGHPSDDPFTRTGYTEGVFTGVGRIHFADRSHMVDLFSLFELRVLEHKLVQREIPSDDWQIATWNLVAVKK